MLCVERTDTVVAALGQLGATYVMVCFFSSQLVCVSHAIANLSHKKTRWAYIQLLRALCATHWLLF